MNSLSIKLLSEIIKLWGKYGKGAFTDLSKLLSQDNFPEEVAHLLDSYMNTVSKQKKTKRKTSPRRNFDTKIKILSNIGIMSISQPEKAELLSLLNEKLMDKELLPTLKDIRVYLEYEQLPMTKARSRDKAVESLFKLFMNMTINELRGHLSNLPKTSDNYQRSLSRWSDIISRKNINENEQGKIEY